MDVDKRRKREYNSGKSGRNKPISKPEYFFILLFREKQLKGEKP